MREPMLLIAEGLAALPTPLLPPERVAKIRKGKGRYDSARDVTVLVGLYREFAGALVHKHPFDEARLAAAEAVGVWLLGAITPSGATRSQAVDTSAAQVRDGLWATILARDTKLRVIARVLFEDAADEVGSVDPLARRDARRCPAENGQPADPNAPHPDVK